MPLELLPVDLGPGVVAAFTTRRGGVSAGAWAEANLARHVGDDPRHVDENRHLLAEAIGAPVTFVNQVHGTDVLTVLGSAGDAPPPSRRSCTNDRPGSDEAVVHDRRKAGARADEAVVHDRRKAGAPADEAVVHDRRKAGAPADEAVVHDRPEAGARADGPQDAATPPDADAVVTNEPGVGIAVLVADCVPVLLADATAGVVGAAHAGRRGLAGGVVQATVKAMLDAGAQPRSIRAAIGPAAGPCCYEVPEDLRDDVAATVPNVEATTRRGTPSLDLRAGAQAILRDLGVGHVEIVGGCTIDDDSFFSYRRDGRTGRFAGVVGLRRVDVP